MTELVDVHELKLLGRHNYENVMAAAAIGGTADYRDAVRTQDEAARCETARRDTAESAFDVIRSVERTEKDRTQ